VGTGVFAMTEQIKALFLPFLAVIIISCAVTPTPNIKQETVYDMSIPDTHTEYLLSPGDILEIIYHQTPQAMTGEYVLTLGDVISVEFYSHPDLNRRLVIRPDGKITIPAKGDITAVGLSPMELARKLNQTYMDIFKHPSITVTLVEYNQALQNFTEAISSDLRGQSKLFPIRPDGYISFPLIADIKAASMTLNQLRVDVTTQYNKIVDNLSISINLTEIKGNVVYVMGEVTKPDFYVLEAPTTVAQILARAGVITDTAKLDTILVVSRNQDNRPVGKLVNLKSILREGNIGNDIILRQYDIVYVPKSAIANAGLFIDQYINNIIPEVFGFNAVYRVD